MINKRNGEIEFFRFLFAIMIFLRHGNMLIVSDKITQLFQSGSLAVDFFFVLSGFLMAASCSKSKANISIGRDTTSFIKRKYFALMPEFLIAWILSFVLHFFQGPVTPGNLGRQFLIWIWELVPFSMAGFTQGSFHMASWYISAMILAQLLLYPFCRKFFDTFTRVIAPVLSILGIGYLALSMGSTLTPSVLLFDGLMFKGFFRAIAVVSLGAAIFPVSERLRSLALTKSGHFLFSICIICFSFTVFAWMIFGNDHSMDIFCVFLMAGIVCLAFSRQSIFTEHFNNKFTMWLGKLSFVLYISHAECARFIKVLYKNLVDEGKLGSHQLRESAVMLILYICATIVFMIIVMLFSKLLRSKKNKIKAQFIVHE